MSITVELSNIKPMIETGIACQVAAGTIATPGAPIVQAFCFCEYECEYTEPVFALAGGTSFENDKSAFARARSLVADSIAFELWKDDVLFATLIDNTYGEFFDFGDFLTQLDVKAFRIDWELVLASGGAGKYQFKSVETIVGVSSTFESRKFQLSKYDLRVANGTVRIETVQNGIISGGAMAFNFKGMGWANMFRMKGKFSTRRPKYDEDSYENSQREEVQIQATIKNSYTLKTRLIPRSVINLLVFDSLLANSIFVTDYNIFSGHNGTQGVDFEYGRIDVKPVEIADPEEFSQSQKELYSIDFVDRKGLPLKRNFE